MIRLYRESDFELLKSWWIEANELPPLKEMMTLDSTFVLEKDGVPVMSLCVYFTNCKHLAYLENFIRNPSLNNSNLYSEKIVTHVEEFARSKGYRIIACLSYKDKLKQRYQQLGYINTLNNLSSFVKILRR